MNKKLKHDGCPEGTICKQFAYTSNLVVYTKYSDIFGLYETQLDSILKLRKLRRC